MIARVLIFEQNKPDVKSILDTGVKLNFFDEILHLLVYFFSKFDKLYSRFI